LIFTNPLEQFRILELASVSIFGFTLNLTNSSIMIFLGTFFFFFFHKLIFINDKFSIRIFSSNWQRIFEIIVLTIRSLVGDTINKQIIKDVFPLILSLFLFILVANLMGLVPYSFTITSHLILTFSLAIGFYISICFFYLRHEWNFFSIFLPGGTNILLGLLLVPIELISFFFKPISLSVRLFANLMAGHTLLKVIAGFAANLAKSSGLFFFAHFVPLFVLIAILGLETGVAFIQAYVFTILICLYLNDAYSLSH